MLTQVEREVLVKAVEIAELEQFFTSFERETIKELGETFNLLANLAGFGIERFIEEAVNVRSISGDELTPGAGAVLEFLVTNLGSWVDLFLRLTGIDDKLEGIDQALLEFDTPDPADVGFALTLMVEQVELLEEALGIVRGDVIPVGKTLFQIVEEAIILGRRVIRDLRGG